MIIITHQEGNRTIISQQITLSQSKADVNNDVKLSNPTTDPNTELPVPVPQQ
jgi:hypothetical protein